MVDTKFIDIGVIETISGQVRHRRKLNKSLFFIDLQPSNQEPKCQVFFRSDDHSLDDVSVQDAYRACRPGQVITIQVGLPIDPTELIDKPYKVWQSNRPVEVIVPYTSREAFTQDRPLGSATEEKQVPIIKKSSSNCKYWINKNKCERGDQCSFQHPTGEAFEKARLEWVKEVIVIQYALWI
jgi:hypothetical protein